MTNKCLPARTEKSAPAKPIWLTANTRSGYIRNPMAKFPIFMLLFCRLDEDGNINNDHNIHLRAQRAAERIAKKRGWTTAVQIRYTNIHQVNRDCMDALRSMPEWSWEEYKNALTRKGYSVHERKDAQHVIRGYALVNGNTKYKASELGIARNLMISKLPKTWDKLHHKPQVTAVSNQPKETQTEQNLKSSASAEHSRYSNLSSRYYFLYA